MVNTLAEVEAVVPNLSAAELAQLEQFIRKTRREKEGTQKPSLRHIKPVSVGKILRPPGSRAEWYDEMLEGKV